MKDIDKIVDNLLEKKQLIKPNPKPKHKHRKRKLLLIGIITTALISVTALGGLLSHYVHISADIDVIETVIKVNNMSCPYSYNFDIENAEAGEYYYQEFNVTNTKDNARFLINWSAISDEGLTITLEEYLPDTYSWAVIEDTYFTVNQSESKLLRGNFTIDLNAEVGNYLGSIELTSYWAYRVY